MKLPLLASSSKVIPLGTSLKCREVAGSTKPVDELLKGTIRFQRQGKLEFYKPDSETFENVEFTRDFLFDKQVMSQ